MSNNMPPEIDKAPRLSKEINLLKDTHRKTENKQKLAVIYRGIGIVFIFGAALLSGVWGWTVYEVRKVESIKADLDTKKYELMQQKASIDAVNIYKKRLYQIKDSGLGKSPEILIAYRDLVEFEKEGETTLTKFDVKGIKFNATFQVNDLFTLKTLLDQFQGEDMKKKWRNVIVDKVSRKVQTVIEINVSGDLITQRD